MYNVELNNSPDLTMEEITKQQFNNGFDSDVQFLVEGKALCSHSWELTKRSKVFREQFSGKLGDNKLIPITDTTYEVFYQFLRFIYTDECNIEDLMIPDMLKLAVRYKIVKLENKVLNLFRPYEIQLKLLEFSLENKYGLNFNYDFDEIIYFLDEDIFFNIKSIVLEEILKSNHMYRGITEAYLFNNLVLWMTKSCELSRTPLSQRRSHFHQLLGLIRFPLMTIDEFNLCHQKHPDLFTNDDISTISSQILLKEPSRTTRWPAQPRIEFVCPWKVQKPAPNQKWVTKFTVSADLIMRGVRCGAVRCDFEIQISETNLKTNTATKGSSFNFILNLNSYCNVITFGDTLKLKPNIDYTVEIKYRDAKERVYCRKPNVNLIITGPSDLITFTEMSDNLFEMFLTLATN